MKCFRVEKTRDFTVMSNHHLRNKDLSLKAKGLMSFILSLPDEWDLTLSGLEKLNLDGMTSIKSAVDELVAFGYLERVGRKRDAKGQFKNYEYVVYEQPKNLSEIEDAPTEPECEKPTYENPKSENPLLDNPVAEKRRQINTKKLNTKELNTDDIKYQSINNTPRKEPECPTCETPILNSDRWIDKYNQTISEIKNQIEYDILVSTSDKTLIDNIVNIMAEVLLVDTPYYEIEGKKIDTELVRINYRKINFEMLDAFLIEYNKIRYKIKNSKYYLITALYNIPLTAAAALANRVQYDIYGVHNE